MLREENTRPKGGSAPQRWQGIVDEVNDNGQKAELVRAVLPPCKNLPWSILWDYRVIPKQGFLPLWRIIKLLHCPNGIGEKGNTMAKHNSSSNRDRVYRDAAAHHLGVGKHQFLTKKDWEKAGFCLISGAKASGSCEVWDYVPKYHKVCKVVRKYFCDTEVQPIAQEQPKAVETESTFFKQDGEYLFYDENVYAGFKWAKDKAWELYHQAEKEVNDVVKGLLLEASKKYSEVAKMYAEG